VVRLVASGFTNDQIAGALGISERGVRAQISRLLKRFDVRNRTGLARAALDAGLGFDSGPAPVPGGLGAQPQVAIPPAQESRLYDDAPFMVAIISPVDFRITYANRLFAQTVGWKTEHLIGRSYPELFLDASPEHVAARNRAAREGILKAVDHELMRWRREDGSIPSGTLTYIVHPLWTLTGAIVALLFIGSAQGGSSSTRGSPPRPRTVAPPPRSSRVARAARATARSLIALLPAAS
jgi:PAS domain S-box-containing protein